MRSVFVAAAICMVWSSTVLGHVKSEPPNILLLVAEDLSPRVGAFGDDLAHTPNIDALAKNGIRFNRVFTTAGVCAPSRAALLTGQYQFSFGGQHMRTSTGPLGPYLALPDENVKAFPELMRRAGYFTYTDRKLDYQFSGVGAGSGPFTIWDREGALPTAWRERSPGQPFFGLINFLQTHESGVMRTDVEPYSTSHAGSQQLRRQAGLIAPKVTDPEQVTLPPYYPDLPEVRADLARHYDNIRQMDAQVGAIVSALEADGLANDTLILWTTDHGDGLPRAKRELYDSGIHVPLILRIPDDLLDHWPLRKGSQSGNLISFVDLAPTLLHFARVERPDWLHGGSFLVTRRKDVLAGRDRIDEVMDHQRALRTDRYKYIRSSYPQVPGGHALNYRDNLDMVRAWRAAWQAGDLTGDQVRWFEPVGAEQLYDLRKDPHELNNLAGDTGFARVKRRMAQRLDELLDRYGDTAKTAEEQMRNGLLVDGEVPVTPAPEILLEEGKLVARVQQGASIGYRAADGEHWSLYVQPLNATAYSNGVVFKAVRYGWRESAETSWAPARSSD